MLSRRESSCLRLRECTRNTVQYPQGHNPVYYGTLIFVELDRTHRENQPTRALDSRSRVLRQALRCRISTPNRQLRLVRQWYRPRGVPSSYHRTRSSPQEKEAIG